jgi:hypothetical protein
MKRCFSILAILALAGCGGGIRVPREKTADPVVFSVDSYSPSPGSVSSVPQTITVIFNQSDVDEGSVNILTRFNMVCGSETFAAAAVSYSTGTTAATVDFSAFTSVVAGTTCKLVVSSDVIDSGGIHLAGNRTASYLYSP